MENTVYVDIGATVAACGCVLAAYAFFDLAAAASRMIELAISNRTKLKSK